ncbi:hypothetical protein [Flagellimonas sp. 2504JD4-2]
MKKIVLPFCFIALISIGLLSMNKFPPKIDFSETLSSEKSKTPEHQIKYSDCINIDDVSNLDFGNIDMQTLQNDVLFEDINQCLEKYELSLDSTIKNLNTIDAHEFLHNEFLRCKKLMDTDSLSAIKKYYNKGIMNICYDRDKKLNSGSFGRVAKR